MCATALKLQRLSATSATGASTSPRHRRPHRLCTSSSASSTCGNPSRAGTWPASRCCSPSMPSCGSCSLRRPHRSEPHSRDTAVARMPASDPARRHWQVRAAQGWRRAAKRRRGPRPEGADRVRKQPMHRGRERVQERMLGCGTHRRPTPHARPQVLLGHALRDDVRAAEHGLPLRSVLAPLCAAVLPRHRCRLSATPHRPTAAAAAVAVAVTGITAPACASA